MASGTWVFSDRWYTSATHTTTTTLTKNTHKPKNTHTHMNIPLSSAPLELWSVALEQLVKQHHQFLMTTFCVADNPQAPASQAYAGFFLVSYAFFDAKLLIEVNLKFSSYGLDVSFLSGFSLQTAIPLFKFSDLLFVNLSMNTFQNLVLDHTHQPHAQRKHPSTQIDLCSVALVSNICASDLQVIVCWLNFH